MCLVCMHVYTVELSEVSSIFHHLECTSSTYPMSSCLKLSLHSLTSAHNPIKQQ